MTTPRLVLPQDGTAVVVADLEKRWHVWVHAEVVLGAPRSLEVPLRPGVTRLSDARQLGMDLWQSWSEAWEALTDAPAGIEIVRSPLGPDQAPRTLRVTGTAAAIALARRLGVPAPGDVVARALRVAGSLHDIGARLTASTLRSAWSMEDADIDDLVEAIRWQDDNPDASGWTQRQAPLPGVHTKWLAVHGTLLRDLTGRDLRAEVRPRPAVAHVTYVDPAYRAGGGRHHDAWTSGDRHDLPYAPRVVLVVENRDCRLWFPPVDGTIVVEGGGKAAVTSLAAVPWVRQAATVAYWGDLDADGFAILDAFRSALASPDGEGGSPTHVTSMLMDAPTLERHRALGTARDKNGRAIRPSPSRLLHLTPLEEAAYHQLSTAGPTDVRRVEQERIPIEEWAKALEAAAGRDKAEGD